MVFLVIPLLFEMCIQLGSYAENTMRDWQYGEATQRLVARDDGDDQLLRITFEAVHGGRELLIADKDRAILDFKDGAQMQCLGEV